MKRTPDKFYVIYYVVQGSGDFPIDMLRYDRSCPASESDSHQIERFELRRVALTRFSAAGKSGPNEARWKSFGWRVVGIRWWDETTEGDLELDLGKHALTELAR